MQGLFLSAWQIIVLAHNHTFACSGKRIECQHHNGNVVNLAGDDDSDDKNIRNGADDGDIYDEEHGSAKDYRNIYRDHSNWFNDSLLWQFWCY